MEKGLRLALPFLLGRQYLPIWPFVLGLGKFVLRFRLAESLQASRLPLLRLLILQFTFEFKSDFTRDFIRGRPRLTTELRHKIWPVGANK